MERIVFLDRKTLKIPLRKPDFPHHWQDYDNTSSNEVIKRLRGATLAITNKVPLKESSLYKLPNLKFIAVAATGVDCVDLTICKKRGIVVSNVPHYTHSSVPEH